jgi:hypothetical protein
MGAEGAVKIARGAAGFDLRSLIELDLGHFDAGEAEGSGVGERSGESGGVELSLWRRYILFHHPLPFSGGEILVGFHLPESLARLERTDHVLIRPDRSFAIDSRCFADVNAK